MCVYICVSFLYVSIDIKYISHLRNWFFLIDSSQYFRVVTARVPFCSYFCCLWRVFFSLICIHISGICCVSSLKIAIIMRKKKEAALKPKCLWNSVFFLYLFSLVCFFYCVSISVAVFCLHFSVFWFSPHLFFSHPKNTVTIFLCFFFLLLSFACSFFMFCARIAGYFFFSSLWLIETHTPHRHYRTRYEMRLTECGCRSLLSHLIVCATFWE